MRKAAQVNYSALNEAGVPSKVPGYSSTKKAAHHNHVNLTEAEVPGNSSTKKPCLHIDLSDFAAVANMTRLTHLELAHTKISGDFVAVKNMTV